MFRSRLATICSLAVVVAVAAACSGAAAGPQGPLWTYRPALAAAPTSLPVPTAVASTGPAVATIALSEWKVATSSALRAGTTTFTISNAGTTEHELLVFKSDLAPSAYPTDPAGDIQEDGPGVDLLSDGENIPVGGTQERTVELKPGTYLFVCNIPGHFKSGMFTVVTVAP